MTMESWWLVDVRQALDERFEMQEFVNLFGAATFCGVAGRFL